MSVKILRRGVVAGEKFSLCKVNAVPQTKAKPFTWGIYRDRDDKLWQGPYEKEHTAIEVWNRFSAALQAPLNLGQI